MKCLNIVLVFTLINLLNITSWAIEAEATKDPAVYGKELIMKADAANQGFKGESSQMTLTLINALGEGVTRKMTSMVLEAKNSSLGDKSLIGFLSPADVKGVQMLTHTNISKRDDQWLYLPSLKTPRRISSKKRTGSFMASEFTYEDLGSQEVAKYTYKFIKEGSVEEKGGVKRSVWIIERKSTDSDSGYSKELVYLDKEYSNPVQIDYYDRKNELMKVSKFSQFKKLDKWWFPHEIDMANVQTGKKSILKWQNRVVNQVHKPSLFTSARLGK